MFGLPEVGPPPPRSATPPAEPGPIPPLFRRPDAPHRPPADAVPGWHQPALDLEFGPSPIPPEFEAQLQIRMLVSGRLRCRTFLAWLAASGHRLARIPREHEIHRILDALAPELSTRRPPAPDALVARLEQAGLSERALAVAAPPF